MEPNFTLEVVIREGPAMGTVVDTGGPAGARESVSEGLRGESVLPGGRGWGHLVAEEGDSRGKRTLKSERLF